MSQVREYCKNRPAGEGFPTWVQDIARGPKNYAFSSPIYYTRGYLFHTREHGQRRRTMNYGVCVRGQNIADATDDETDFYGTVEKIIQLHYKGLLGLKITVFKCQWYDPTINKGTRRRDNGRIVDVLATGRYRKYDPFILDSQADQVCYVPYPSLYASRPVWLNVIKVNPRAKIVGNFTEKDDLILLQQDVAHDVTPERVIRVDRLSDETNDDGFIDYALADADPADEFLCNMSSSDDEEYGEENV